MKNGELDLRDARLISQADFEEWTRKALPMPGDVVLSRRCNPGETARVRNGQVFALGQNLVLLRSIGKHVLPVYLVWLVRSSEWWNEVEKHRNPGAVFDSLKCRDIPLFTLTIPPIVTQQQIAELLGALDDKIELNRRMATTLEEMTRTLFKSWFVDFDPVHARAEGRATGLADDLAGLFPDSFGEDGVPTGWAVRTVGDLYQISGGSTPSTEREEYWGGPHEWASPKDLSSLDAPVLLQTGRRLTDAGLAQVSSGLLPPRSLLLSSRAPIGYMAFTTAPTAINQGFAGIIRKEASTAYAWAWCHARMNVIKGNAGGSTFPEISKAVFRQLPMLDPGGPALNAFSSVADGLIARITAAVQQQKALADLRDTLLPKLISGELHIADAERHVAAA